MTKGLSYIFVFVLGILITQSYMSKNPIKNTKSIESNQSESPRISPLKLNNNKNLFPFIYSQLDIRNGDILKEVNGIQADGNAMIFPEMITGFKAKNLCIKFERDGQLFQHCLQNNERDANTKPPGVPRPNQDFSNRPKTTLSKSLEPYTTTSIQDGTEDLPAEISTALKNGQIIPRIVNGKVTGYYSTNQ